MDLKHKLRGKRLVWVTRSFLHYRVPVFAALDVLTGGKLTVVFNGDYVPDGVQAKLREVLGDRAVALHGEFRVGPNAFGDHAANRAVRIPWQPGLLRAVRECQPDILISDGFFQWTPACLWLRARHGIPHVMCYERTRHTERNAQWYRKLYRRWARRFIDAFCCSGTLCGEYTHSLGVPEDRITYGHMVADVDHLRAASGHVSSEARQKLREQLGLKGVVFVCVGRVVEMKGIHELLQAWQHVSNGRDAAVATLCVVGDGPARSEAEAFCKAHGLASVRFAGCVDYDALPSFYAAADCLVMPTLEDNWSLVVPEAMACGLPLLCSQYNGCFPELVQEGANGWVFDPLNHDRFVAAFRRAVSKSQTLDVMGARSREIVSGYTPSTAARAVFDACKMVGLPTEDNA